MHCPFCFAVDTKVIDSRLVGEGSSVRRRRQCLVCNERFTTFEVAELVMPRVVKSNDVREPFNEEKLRSGMLRALEKRPVSSDDVEMAINHIKSQLRATGEREVPSKMIGNLVMEQLKKLDKVAYIRFASVYRSFEDIKEFGEDRAHGGLSRAGRVLHGAGAKAGATRTFYHASQPECRVRHCQRWRNCR